MARTVLETYINISQFSHNELKADEHFLVIFNDSSLVIFLFYGGNMKER